MNDPTPGEDVYRKAAEAALRAHVGADAVDGLSAEYLAGLITDWWDTADSRARVDAAYAAGHRTADDQAALMGRQITALIELCGRHEADGVIPVDEVYAVITTDPDGEKDR